MRRVWNGLQCLTPFCRFFRVSASSSSIPRGMRAFPLRDSATVLESIADAYVQMNLRTMKSFHECIIQSIPRAAGSATPVYEEMLLGGDAQPTNTHVATHTTNPSTNSTTNSTNSTSASTVGAKKTAEKTAFDVILKQYPAGNKVKLIKELRAVSGLPLQEAKAAIERAPGALVTAMPKANAEKLKQLLTGHGAEVELV